MGEWKPPYEPGEKVNIRFRGEVVEAVYEEWSYKYGIPVVRYKGRRIHTNAVDELGNTIPKRGPNGEAPRRDVRGVLQAVKKSRFDVNTRFQFIADLVDMVVQGESNSVIISGSGGLGKTYTVQQRLEAAELTNVDDTEHECDDVCEEVVKETGMRCPMRGDYQVVKGFASPKGLYRILFDNRKNLLVFDDCDSMWDHPTSQNMLKTALDSYDVRRISWLSEIRGETGLPKNFLFEGKIIFVSNLSLTELDQAVLSRCLYVDVSMDADEKIERIKAISPAIRPEMAQEMRDEALELLAEKRHEIGDLNIRTYLKVLEIRHADHKDWRDMAEYVVTAL